MPHRLGKLVVYDSRPAPLLTRLSRRGYTVLVARDESQLQALAARERPDLLIGDLGANSSTPVGVCRRLKSNLLLRNLPIIVVAQHGELESRVAAVNGGADDYLVEPYAEEELFARINRAVRRACESLDANPVTRLPGNASIKAEIDGRLDRGEVFAVLFVDLDNFKAFNDRYGFDRGDEALRLLGDIVLEAIEQAGNGPTSDFAGNIGGDDFVVITSVGRADALAQRICELVDQRMPSLFDGGDRRAGYITSVDRQGCRRLFTLMSVSIAIVSNDEYPIRHHSEFSQIGSEIKQYLKRHPGLRSMKNRRREPGAPAVLTTPAPAV